MIRKTYTQSHRCNTAWYSYTHGHISEGRPGFWGFFAFLQCYRFCDFNINALREYLRQGSYTHLNNYCFSANLASEFFFFFFLRK